MTYSTTWSVTRSGRYSERTVTVHWPSAGLVGVAVRDTEPPTAPTSRSSTTVRSPGPTSGIRQCGGLKGMPELVIRNATVSPSRMTTDVGEMVHVGGDGDADGAVGPLS